MWPARPMKVVTGGTAKPVNPLHYLRRPRNLHLLLDRYLRLSLHLLLYLSLFL